MIEGQGKRRASDRGSQKHVVSTVAFLGAYGEELRRRSSRDLSGLAGNRNLGGARHHVMHVNEQYKCL